MPASLYLSPVTRHPSAYKRRGPGKRRALEELRWRRSAWLHHPAHVGHATADAGAVLVRDLRDDRLRREDVLRDRRRVLQRRASDHRRVDDAGSDEVDD